MKNYDLQMCIIIKIKGIKTLEQNKQLDIEENNHNFCNLVDLVGKLELPKLKTSSNYSFK